MPEAYKLTDMSNFQSWKSHAKLMLMQDSVWRYVDPGVSVSPRETDDIALARICKSPVHRQFELYGGSLLSDQKHA